jgi:hypothetical protein
MTLVECAGRDPAPVATVQPTDSTATCAMIVAEIEANNVKVKELADEQGWKVALNVAAGVAGVVVPAASPATISHDAGDGAVCKGGAEMSWTALTEGKWT